MHDTSQLRTFLDVRSQSVQADVTGKRYDYHSNGKWIAYIDLKDSHFDGMMEFMVEIALTPGHKCILAGKEESDCTFTEVTPRLNA